MEPYTAYPAAGDVTEIPWDPQSTDTVYVRVVDRAGNLSAVASALVSAEHRVYLPTTLRKTP